MSRKGVQNFGSIKPKKPTGVNPNYQGKNPIPNYKHNPSKAQNEQEPFSQQKSQKYNKDTDYPSKNSKQTDYNSQKQQINPFNTKVGFSRDFLIKKYKVQKMPANFLHIIETNEDIFPEDSLPATIEIEKDYNPNDALPVKKPYAGPGASKSTKPKFNITKQTSGNFHEESKRFQEKQNEIEKKFQYRYGDDQNDDPDWMAYNDEEEFEYGVFEKDQIKKETLEDMEKFSAKFPYLKKSQKEYIPAEQNNNEETSYQTFLKSKEINMEDLNNLDEKLEKIAKEEQKIDDNEEFDLEIKKQQEEQKIQQEQEDIELQKKYKFDPNNEEEKNAAKLLEQMEKDKQNQEQQNQKQQQQQQQQQQNLFQNQAQATDLEQIQAKIIKESQQEEEKKMLFQIQQEYQRLYYYNMQLTQQNDQFSKQISILKEQGPFQHHSQIKKGNIYQKEWTYIDKRNQIQGPFESCQMDMWNSQKYFPNDFKVKYKLDQWQQLATIEQEYKNSLQNYQETQQKIQEENTRVIQQLQILLASYQQYQQKMQQSQQQQQPTNAQAISLDELESQFQNTTIQSQQNQPQEQPEQTNNQQLFQQQQMRIQQQQQQNQYQQQQQQQQIPFSQQNFSDNQNSDWSYSGFSQPQQQQQQQFQQQPTTYNQQSLSQNEFQQQQLQQGGGFKPQMQYSNINPQQQTLLQQQKNRQQMQQQQFLQQQQYQQNSQQQYSFQNQNNQGQSLSFIENQQQFKHYQIPAQPLQQQQKKNQQQIYQKTPNIDDGQEYPSLG